MAGGAAFASSEPFGVVAAATAPAPASSSSPSPPSSSLSALAAASSRLSRHASMCFPGRDGSLAAARSLAAAYARAGDAEKAEEEDGEGKEEGERRRRRALAAASKAPTSATPREATHSRSGARPVEDKRSSSLTPSERLFFFLKRKRKVRRSSRRRRRHFRSLFVFLPPLFSSRLRSFRRTRGSAGSQQRRWRARWRRQRPLRSLVRADGSSIAN